MLPKSEPRGGTAPPTEEHRKGQSHTEPTLGVAVFRVLRAMVFEQKPLPELNALPMAQLRLLWAVQFHSASTMTDLSERLGVSQSTVTQLAAGLVRRGFIERIPDPQDRRLIRLRPSDFGRGLLERADTERRLMAEAIWSKMSPREREDVLHGLDILGRVAEAVRAEKGHPLPPCTLNASRSAVPPEESEAPTQSQSVFDLMARRVRGQ